MPIKRNAAESGMETKEKRADKGAVMAKRASLPRILVSLVLGVVVLIFVIAISFLLLQISGKNSLYSRADNGEMVNTLSGIAVELGGSIEEEEGDEDWQEGDFRFEGIHYRYNEDILTFLFMGIDKMTEVAPVEDGLDGGQSDAIFLLVLNSHTKEITVIGIPRDIMAEVQIYDKEGNYRGIGTAQLAIQHGYGDGAELSCERSMQAVSKLFYGLPIHGYCAINMGAVPLINDAVGGIDLKATETLDFDNFRVTEGEDLHLEGMDAYYYLHNRDTKSEESAARRLTRQKEYLIKYAAKAIEATKKDITFPVSLYSTLSKYMVTDISVDEVSYLATQALGYSFDGDNMHVLQGEIVQGERFEEFYADEDALYRLILKVFYEEVN
jgi:LCP family protein required for cell wall assembly